MLPWAASVFILAIVAVVFHGGHAGAFLRWDDDINIVNNPHLREPAAESIRWMFTDVSYMRRYVPLAWLGWWIDHQLFGLTSRSAHVGNSLFHGANAVLVFLVLQHVLTALKFTRSLSFRASTTAAMIGALVWAVHPLRVEVVAWASGRMYCMAGFFLFLAVLAYFRAARGESRNTHSVWIGVATLAFGASLLTYPIGLMFVAVLIVIDVWVLRRFQPGGVWADRGNRAVLLEKIPFVAVTLVVAAATLAARFHAQGLWQPPPTLAEFGVAARAMQAGYIWIYYVLKPLLPVGLAPVYPTLVEFNPAGLKFIFSALTLVVVTVFLIRGRRRWPGAFALWLTHLLLLAPMLGLTEHPHYANDRYSYLQGVLWSLALVGAWGMAQPIISPHGITLAATAFVGALGVASAAQIKLWQNDETFFRALYARQDDVVSRADIAFRLGDALRTKSRFAEAAEYYRESLRLVPNGVRAAIPHFGLAVIAQKERRIPAAFEHYQAAIALDPNFAQASQGAGELMITIGQPGQAVPLLQRAVSLAPDNGDVRELLAVAYFQTGKFADAVAEFSTAVRLGKKSVQTLCNLASALCATGRLPEAVACSEDAVRLAPASAEAHLRLGEALQMSGRMAEAIGAMRTAAKLEPGSASILTSLGSTLAVAGQFQEAADSFRKATQLDPSFVRAHFNLGLALRDSGRRAEAVAAFEDAIRLKPDYTAAREELARLQVP